MPTNHHHHPTNSSSSSSSKSDASAQSAVLDNRAAPLTAWTYVFAMCAAINSINLGFDIGKSQKNNQESKMLFTPFPYIATPISLGID